MNLPREKERFSIVKRAMSFTHGGRGIWVYLKTTHNAWIHLTVLALAVLLGIYFRIEYFDWMLLAFAGGLVLMAEAFNTAIEIDIDLTSPEYHPYARDTKDVAAGAVLIASITAAIIGLGIFGHYFIGIGQNVLGTKHTVACTTEAKICPDGSAVGRTGPNCEFAPCPSDYVAQ